MLEVTDILEDILDRFLLICAKTFIFALIIQETHKIIIFVLLVLQSFIIRFVHKKYFTI